MLDTHIMTHAQRKCLLSAASNLHEQFRGVFGEETIQALLFSSYAELAARATIDHWLVIGAERFTLSPRKGSCRAPRLFASEDPSAESIGN